jgi:membrane dipeptidase
MASHSNAHAIMPHNRNLRDDQIMAIVESGGIIGLNINPPFLTQSRRATIDDLMAHFRHFLQLGAREHIGLGCDFDGISSTPEGIIDVSSLKTLSAALAAEFDEDASFRIMESNFYEFFKRYFEG